MEKVLLAFPYKKSDKYFDQIIKKFDRQDYTIHVFEVINSNIDINLLPSIIDSLGIDRGSKIDVISNVRELIFAWFRCYNSLIDDFIYFMDSSFNLFDHRLSNFNEFSSMLANFNNIDEEEIQGKIYVNFNQEINKNFVTFLIRNNNFKYFDVLGNFSLQKKYNKQIIEKTYRYKDQELKFKFKGLAVNKVERVTITNSRPMNDIDLNSYELIKMLDNNLYFVLYLLKYLYAFSNKNIVLTFTKLYFDHLNDLGLKEKEIIYQHFIKYINRNNLKFKERIFFLSLLVKIKPEEEYVLKKLMETMLNEYENINIHYSIIYNIEFYLNRLNLVLYDGYFRDRKKEIKKISNYYSQNIELPNKTKKQNTKRIAVVVDQLLGKNHSPTKIILDYVHKLKEFYSEYEIKIFVEDNFVIRPNEYFSPYVFSSAKSIDINEEYKIKFKKDGIGIYYADTRMDRIIKTKNLIEELIRFEPDIIWTTSYLSPSIEMLYPNYPVLSLPMSSNTYATNSADVYLYVDKSKAVELNNKYKLVNANNIYDFALGAEFPASFKSYQRSDYGLEDNDLLLVTVGNRLDAELDKDNEFIDSVCGFLTGRSDVRWLIVGDAELKNINFRYDKLMKTNKILRISYEDDLAALYKICNIYINPDREGGGISIARAMNEGLPVVNFNKPSAGFRWIGRENCVNNNLIDYMKEVNLLYSDHEYRSKKGHLMKARIKEEFSFENSINQLVKMFNLTQENFKTRTKSYF